MYLLKNMLAESRHSPHPNLNEPQILDTFFYGYAYYKVVFLLILLQNTHLYITT